MTLAGRPLLIFTILLALGGVATTLALWDRPPADRAVRWAARGTMILACQLTALLVLSVAINDSFGFYASWSDLLGGQQQLLPAAVAVGHQDKVYGAQISANSVLGRGTVVPFTIPGTASGVRPQAAFAYLPPQYGEPAYAHRSFPVVELLDGYPGSPKSWLQSLRIAQNLDAEIAAGRTVPMIAVMPTQTVAPPRDTECLNVPHGPQAETFLTTDVRSEVLADFRASHERRGWAVMGYSTGGFCAANLLLHHASMFGAGVSMAGYYSAIRDATTGDLYGKSAALRRFDSPTWFVAHRPVGSQSLLIVDSREDPGGVAGVTAFLDRVRAPLQVSTLILRHGGHNPAVWRAEEPACLDWLGHQLSAPLAAGWQVRDVPQVLPRYYDWHRHRGVPAPAPSSPATHLAAAPVPKSPPRPS